MTTFYIDPEQGSNSSSGLSYGNRRRSISGTSLVGAGDTFRFVSSSNPTTVLSSGTTWISKSSTVSLNVLPPLAPPPLSINSCDTFWSNGGVLLVNVTRDFIDYVQGSSSLLITIPSFSAPGVLAYDKIDPNGFAVNLSAYQQINFWCKTTIPVAYGNLKINLCSDLSGSVPVNSFLLPSISSPNVWTPLTLDNGSPLGNSIRSIAIRMEVPMIGNLNFDSFLVFSSPSVGPPNMKINNCNSLWNNTGTPSTTVIRDNSDYRLGSSSLLISRIGPVFPGVLAYDKIDPNGFDIDFSIYQQISFWYKTSTAVPTGYFVINLCSDLSGSVPVNSFLLPSISSPNVWTPLTLDNGSPLGNSIRSIAIRTSTSFTLDVDIHFDNFIAVKNPSSADSLSLTSLITNDVTSGNWWAIRSISGSSPTFSPLIDTQNIITLDQHPRTSPTTLAKGYYGSSSINFPLYKRETIKTDYAFSDFTNIIDVPFPDIKMSGGWSRSSGMTIQNGDTWLDGSNCFGVGVNSSLTGVTTEKIACVRYRRGWQINGTMSASIRAANNNSDVGVSISGITTSGISLISIDSASSNGTSGVECNSPYPVLLGNLRHLESNFTYGLNFSSPSRVVSTGTIETYNNTSGGINALFFSSSIQNVITSDNGGNGLYLQSSGTTSINSLTALDNNSLGSGVEIRGGSVGTNYIRINNILSSGSFTGITTSGNYMGRVYVSNARLNNSAQYINGAFTNLYFNKLNGVIDRHLINTKSGGIIYSETGIERRTASGIAWRMQPIFVLNVNSDFPLSLSIAKMLVKSGSLVIFKAWMKRTHSSEISGRIVIFGGRIAGVPSDISTSITAGAGVYQELTLTFTPTEVGVVEVFAEVYHTGIDITSTVVTSHSVYVDDLSHGQV